MRAPNGHPTATPMRAPNGHPTFLLATPNINTNTNSHAFHHTVGHPQAHSHLAPTPYVHSRVVNTSTKLNAKQPSVLNDILNTKTQNDAEKQKLKEKLATLELTLINAEKERNFYFNKLVEIESLTEKFSQNIASNDTKFRIHTEKALSEQIQSILYGQIEEISPEKLQQISQLFENFKPC